MPTTTKQELLAKLDTLARRAIDVETLMRSIADELHSQLTRYNWVGFYLLADDEPETLVLGPYTGSFSPHKRIPLSQGLCGAAARTGTTVVVNDVTADPRYLQGSDTTKSEIVVPIFAQKRFAAELDINSYFANTFGPEDQRFVEDCAKLVGKYMDQQLTRY
jgi:GAF domain-containing protein